MLEQFFSGILHQLQGEVDLINALVPHNATKGDLNEQSLKRILASFLPNRYAIGSGFVVDSFGARSKQVDIVVYDAIYSTKLFNATSQVIFPVETVLACIEVKTQINRAGLEEIVKENEAINKLQHYAPAIQAVRTSGSPPPIQLSERNTRPPLTFTVASHTESDNPSTVR